MSEKVPTVRCYQNENGPTIGVTVKGIIEKDGLYFRDIDGKNEFKPYMDWRLSPRERAEALAGELLPEEKAGLLFVNQKNMGLLQEDKSKVDPTGLLDEEVIEKGESIFTVEKTYGTTYTLEEMFIRHIIFRQNPPPADLARFSNQLNVIAEGCRVAIPVLLVSNSRNELGRRVFGMNDAFGVFPTWPGTMGIASAYKARGKEVAEKFASCVREVWDACGLKKGYMYMADPLTDPRWQRSYGTFGEDVELITEIIGTLLPIIQGSEEGVSSEGVAMTVKHFPGGGARENGFDPHYRQGQWNVYATEGSLETYHLPPFYEAVRKKAASIMPYYAKPSNAKSARQNDPSGEALDFQEVGFAYNKYFIQELLRGEMGFEGYVNSDSGITHKMAWGVEELDPVERVALAINNGVDLISGSMAVWDAKEAFKRYEEDYYGEGGHPVPEKYQAEDLYLTPEAVDRAVIRTLEEMFALGLFENPYRDPEHAAEVCAEQGYWDEAYRVHQESVVLAKNKNHCLPLSKDELETKTFYLRCFDQDEKMAEAETLELKGKLSEKYGLHFAESPEQAEIGMLYLTPNSGAYFSATPGFLEIDLCEKKKVCAVDEEGCPTEEMHEETTVAKLSEFHEAAETIRRNGGKVIVSLNVTLPWMPGNAEPYADAFLIGFDSYKEAVFDVAAGACQPVGRMPVTLPRSDEVIKVDKKGRCISPNDVPGYDKDLYMPDSLKDENGKAYAYRDSEGNYYELNFGLSYD